MAAEKQKLAAPFWPATVNKPVRHGSVDTGRRPANEPTIGGSASTTMSSTDLLELINAERAAFGESEVRRNDFIARCRDELDGEHYETFVVTNANGTKSEVLDLTRDQCMLVSMRESKGVRRAVQVKLKAAQEPATALPNFADPVAAARAWADQYEQRQLAVEQRDHAIRTKAEIGSRREATAMATAGAAMREVKKLKAKLGEGAEFASIIAVNRAFSLKLDDRKAWRPLKKWAEDNGVKPLDAIHPRWGKVKRWPAGAWLTCYGIALADKFGADGEDA